MSLPFFSLAVGIGNIASLVLDKTKDTSLKVKDGIIITGASFLIAGLAGDMWHKYNNLLDTLRFWKNDLEQEQKEETEKQLTIDRK